MRRCPRQLARAIYQVKLPAQLTWESTIPAHSAQTPTTSGAQQQTLASSSSHAIVAMEQWNR